MRVGAFPPGCWAGGEGLVANLDVKHLPVRDQAERWLRDLLRRSKAWLKAAPGLSAPARWALGLLALIVLTGVAAVGLALFLMFAPIKLPEPIEGSRAASTEILGVDGSLIEKWHGPINRTPVALDDMSKHLQDAAVAAEDSRFHRRGAVDLRAVLRAAWVNLVNGEYVQGGSTISQQYAKNVYVGNDISISRKIMEARVAYRLERDLGKAKVLEGYLNTVYFGRGAYGVETAANIYFGKAASDVTVSEAALLVAMIRSPDAYSPYRHPERSEARRDWVLDRMEKLGHLDSEQAAQARQEAPVLTPASEAHPRYGWYLDAVRTYLIGKYGADKVYSGGLKVQTTLDPQAQEAAEATLANILPDPEDPYAALVSIDPATGYVKALVGGRDYSEEKYNIALQGRRQPGSAFKPFVLAAALEDGIPASARYRAPRTICLEGWSPSCVSNYGRAGYGRMDLERATVNSVNTVYAQLVMQVGPEKVVDLARRAGIPGPEWLPSRSGCKSSAEDACGTQIQPVPALALGSEEVTPLELASGYATLAAGGVYREPKLVSRVEDADGTVLEEGPSVGVQAISPSVAEEVNQILSGVIARGTGTRADFGRPAAGKTGTAQDHSNAWFSGYTPQLATSVWVGHRSSNKALLNVQGVRRVTGGSLPAEMWSEYMKGVIDRTPPTLALESGPEKGEYSGSNLLKLEGSAADEEGMVQGIEISIDGGPFGSAGALCRRCPAAEADWTYESPSELPDGEHTFAVRSFDKAGHRSEAVGLKVVVDTRRPELHAVAVTGGSNVVEAGFDEAIACEGIRPSAFDVSAGGSRVRVVSAACSGGVAEVLELTLAEPVRGGERVSVEVAGRSGLPSDRAGNPTGSATRSTEASNLSPLVKVEPGEPLPATATGVRLSGTAVDPDGTLEGLEVSVDGGPFSAVGVDCGRCERSSEAGWTYSPSSAMSNGSHTFEVRSVDNAGARSSAYLLEVTVDSIVPTLVEVQSEGASEAVDLAFSEPVVCSDNADRQFSVRVDSRRARVVDAVCDGTTARLSISPAPEGGEEVELSVRAPSRSRREITDPAGNPLAGASASVAASNRPPILELAADVEELLLVPADESREEVRVEGRAWDPDGRVAEVEVSVDGGPFSAEPVRCRGCGRTGEVTFWTEIEHAPQGSRRTVDFRARDGASALSSGRGSGLTSDAESPVFKTVSARPGDSTITAVFSKPIACRTVAKSDFRVVSSGDPRSILTTVCQGESQAEVRFRMSERTKPGETISVELAGEVADPAGNVVQRVTLKGLRVPRGS
jgi:penicillin-binding protein 1A